MTPQAVLRDILIVDDDFEIRDTLSQLLKEEGYSVSSAVNGQEALRMLRQGLSPRLILLDLMMPVMNGWQFRAEQRADPALSAVPVVVITATGNLRAVGEAAAPFNDSAQRRGPLEPRSSEAQGRAPSIDAADILKKPIDLEHLLQTIARHVVR